MNAESNPQKSFRVGYAAIVGKPNVGKSTLMNRLLRQKLAIVSPKPQTTRHRILGILNGRDHQVIFLDTPGLMHPKYRLQKNMVKTAQKTMKEADLILMMVEATGVSTNDENVVHMLNSLKAQKFLLVNKVDLVQKNRLLPLIENFQEMALFQEIVPISALRSDGLDLLLSLILKYLPEGEPFYPPDMVSDEPERFFVSEIIREQIFIHYGEEIPYSAAVQIETFEEKPEHKDYIRAIVNVERDSQKGIIIGKGGQTLKKVGIRARENIEQFLGRPVFLELDVRVKKNWRKNDSLIKRMGY